MKERKLKDRQYTYTANLKLKDNEAPAVVNLETGVITQAKFEHVKEQPKDKTMKYFDIDEPFSRTFTKSWKLLETQTTVREFAVAMKLANRARAYTNDLRPLNADSSLREIAEELNENKDAISKIIEKLFKLGVIASFEVSEHNEHYQKYWVFNPYLSFNGKVIKKGLEDLFSNTTYALLIRGAL